MASVPRLRAPVVASVACCTVEPSRIVFPAQSTAANIRRELAAEPGFIDVLGAVELRSGQLYCVTLWESELDAHCGRARKMAVLAQLRTLLLAGAHLSN